jgi:hypothetical protein
MASASGPVEAVGTIPISGAFNNRVATLPPAAVFQEHYRILGSALPPEAKVNSKLPRN